MTSGINPETYFRCFESCPESGKDVLYLCFSSGLSGTIQSEQLCVQELWKEYPECKIICIDTLCAAVGEGFFVREAARKQAEGMSFDELAQWAVEHRLDICQWFAVDTFEHLKHGGRVGTATVTVGTMLHVKPMLHVNETGNLEVAEKPRGRRYAVAAQMKKLEQGWNPERGNRILIGHGSYTESAQLLRQEILERFPDAKISTTEIGPVIGQHTGPSMLALIHKGSNR